MADEAGIRSRVLRELYEGAPPTFERLALLSRRTADTIRERAERENWGEMLEKTSEEDRLAQLKRLNAWVIDQLDGLKQRASEDGVPVDKGKIESLSTFARTVEKLGEVTRSAVSTKENQIKRDARAAGILKRIDKRIVELAMEYAKQLGAEHHKPRRR